MRTAVRPARRPIVAAGTVIAAAALLGVSSCATWQPLTPSTPPDRIEDHPVKVTVAEGTIEARATHIQGPFLHGEVTDRDGKPRPVILNLAAIEPGNALVRTYSRKTERIVGIAVSVGLSAFFASLISVALLTAERRPSSWTYP